jgi:hypothetical protein
MLQCRDALAHLSVPVPAGFMIVSLPDEAAFTICCSTDLLILALSACITIQSGLHARKWRKCEEEKRKEEGRGSGVADLVHGCVLDGSSLLWSDRATAFLCICRCLVGMSCIVGRLGFQTFCASLDHVGAGLRANPG